FLDRRDPSENWALFEGRPVMMTGGTHRHSLIIGNVYRAVWPLARRIGCEAHASDLLITSPNEQQFAAAPDVFVRRGPVQPTSRLVDDPILVIEVLSPSTMASDRGYKFNCYTTIPSLQQILFVYADEARVESWTRAEPEWRLEIISTDRREVNLP